MKKISIAGALVSGAMLGALAVGSAMAADMPAKAPMLMKAPPPVATWTGCYIGGGGGYGMWSQDNFVATTAGVATGLTVTAGGKGWFGTVGAGCDYQVSSNIVIGAYGDWDFGDINGQLTPGSDGFVGNESEKWAWAGGARIGWLVTPSVLAYFSGGYTQGHFNSVSFNSVVAPFAPAAFGLSANTYNGWFLGSGFDYAISILPSGFFLRSEYRYSTFQEANPAFSVVSTGLPDGFTLDSKKYVQTVRSELIYRFNWH
jgi:hypothetical protein